MLVIDKNKCNKCGFCVDVCPSLTIRKENGEPIEKNPLYCIKCGHCVAICPVRAIQHNELPMEDFIPLKKPQWTLDAFNELVYARRSIRCFKSKPVTKHDMELLMNSLKFAPTGGNAQELEYIIISNPGQLELVRQSVMTAFRKLDRMFEKALIRKLMTRKIGQKGIDYLQAAAKIAIYAESEGNDLILRKAPMILIAHSSESNEIAKCDGGIAGYHLSLACETLGLGTCWLGFLMLFSNQFAPVRQAAQIPESHGCLMAMAIGYPTHPYTTLVSRKLPSIRFIE